MEQTPIRTPEIGTQKIPTVEQGPSPERGPEFSVPAPDLTATDQVVPVVPVAPVVPTSSAASNVTSLHQSIEAILSEDLQAEYEQLDPATQQQFRQVGESTVTQIETLLQSTKVQIQKIIGLIMGWLKILPGVNSFFVQQEAKIKADKILKLRP